MLPYKIETPTKNYALQFRGCWLHDKQEFVVLVDDKSLESPNEKKRLVGDTVIEEARGAL